MTQDLVQTQPRDEARGAAPSGPGSGWAISPGDRAPVATW